MLKNDLLAYVPGQCQKYKAREDCLGRGSRAAGVKCVWNSKKENCERHPAARPQSGGIQACLEDNASRNGTRFVIDLIHYSWGLSILPLNPSPCVSEGDGFSGSI